MPRRADFSLLVTCFALTLASACEAPRSTQVCEPGAPCPAAANAGARCVVERALYGRTAQADGSCGASDPEACRAASITCAAWGQCTPPAGARAAGPSCAWNESDRDLQAAREPACTGRVTCFASSDDDCRRARICGLEGRCRAQNGVCVATPETCRESRLCSALGWCTPTAQGLCRAASVSDCERSAGCKRERTCGLLQGSCVDCAQSEACRADGRCDAVDGSCRATANEHCQRAEVCKRQGLCRAFQGACTR